MFVRMSLHTHATFSGTNHCANVDGIVHACRPGSGHGLRLLKSIIAYHALKIQLTEN